MTNSIICSGAAEDMAHSSLRFGIGRFTTEAEIDYVVDKIIATVEKLRDMRYVIYFPLLHRTIIDRLILLSIHSPLWEMVQEGIDINTIDWAQH